MYSHILLIDDDKALCHLLKNELQMAGYQADIAYDGIAGLSAVGSKEYQLVVLDVLMPGLDGFAALRQIRQRSNLPILMLTAREDYASRVKGLQAGADDYLTKPFDLGEFKARVQALLRRYTYFNVTGKEEKLEFPGMVILPEGKQVLVNGREVLLSYKEFELLIYCAQNQGKILSKKKIFEAVWQQEYVYGDSTVMTTISRLRKKIDGYDSSVSYIETVKGMGYRFCPAPREQAGEA